MNWVKAKTIVAAITNRSVPLGFDIFTKYSSIFVNDENRKRYKLNIPTLPGNNNNNNIKSNNSK